METDEVERAKRYIELGRQKVYGKPEQVTQEQPSIGVNPEVNPGLLRMFPPERLERIMKKEARRYKAALRKKWDHWLEAVSK